jgi:hypothetical protein
MSQTLCASSHLFFDPANPGPLADHSLTVAGKNPLLDSALAQAVANMTAHMIESDVKKDEWKSLDSLLGSISFCAAAVNSFMDLHVSTKWAVCSACVGFFAGFALIEMIL